MTCEGELQQALKEKAVALIELNQFAEEHKKQDAEIKRLATEIATLRSEKKALQDQIESLRRGNPKT